jgi:hypothetical protein
VDDDDEGGESWTATVVVTDGAGAVVASRTISAPPGLELIGTLARLQLEARRVGCAIGVRDSAPELRELLDLAGLTEVLDAACGCVCPSGSVLEVVGQPEGGEQLGVEEVVEPGDPPV